MRRKSPAASMWLLIDANGCVGADSDGACGNCEPDNVTDNGMRLITLLNQIGPAAYNTSFNVGYTWWSRHGTVARGDC
eukprot:9798418-Karenia_brevis.AAC.1